jgi:hypothetical protein
MKEKALAPSSEVRSHGNSRIVPWSDPILYTSVMPGRQEREKRKGNKRTNGILPTMLCYTTTSSSYLSLHGKHSTVGTRQGQHQSPTVITFFSSGFFFFKLSHPVEKKGMIVLVSQQLFHFRRPSCLYIFFFSLLALKILWKQRENCLDLDFWLQLNLHFKF